MILSVLGEIMICANDRSLSFFTVQKNKGSAVFPEALSYVGVRICFVLSGEAVWHINGCLYPVKQGDIVFLNSSQKRRFVEYGDSFSLGVISLDRSAFVDPCHYLFLVDCIRKQNGVIHNQTLWELLDQVYVEWQKKDFGYFEMVSAKLTEFFISAERNFNFSVCSLGKNDRTMMYVLDYLDSNMTEKITLSRIARETGFTESSFSRWFAQWNGISFKRYVLTRKIELAVRAIETTDMKMLDVAASCGFESISGFYDAFKKITGTTPGKYSSGEHI